MTEKNIFVHLFVVKYFRLLCKNCNPLFLEGILIKATDS